MPPLLQALSGIARQIETQIPVAQRDLYLINRFCARQSQRLKQASQEIGGWLAIVFIVFLAAAVFAFAIVGPITGTVSSIALLVAFFVIRQWAIHHRVAQAIRPQLARCLSGTGIAWTQLEGALDSGEPRYPQLRRHFKRGAYNQFRHESNLEEFIDNGNCDVIVPHVDEAAERRAARSDLETAR